MGKAICWARVAALGYSRGHKWQPVMHGNHLTKGAPIQVCLRCRENGWLV